MKLNNGGLRARIFTEMHGVPSKLKSQSGASLVEVMVVALIIIIVATITFMSAGSSNEQFQRQNAARQLKETFERARFDSVKRRADGDALRPLAYVEVRANGFTLRTFIDSDANAGTAPVARDQDYPIAAGVAIEHYSSASLPMVVTFDRRGAPGADARFRVTETRSSTSEVVIVTPTGTVNLVGSVGNSVNFNFSNPTLSGNPGDGESINNDVIIP